MSKKAWPIDIYEEEIVQGHVSLQKSAIHQECW